MKNSRFFKVIISTLLLISGCKSDSSTDSEPYIEPDIPPEEDTSIFVDVRAESFYNDQYYDLKFKYDDSFFDGSAEVFNKDLALMSLGEAFVSGRKDTSRELLTSIGFTDFVDSSYDEPRTLDSVAFVIARKKIKNYYLVSIFVRSLKYGTEWGNNFNIGTQGDHLGFSLKASEIKTALETYISSYCANDNVKLWLSGYSRGAGITNVLASQILHNNTINVLKENMFVYTFGCPNCISEENFVAYKNVHNIVNSADAVTNIPPSAYGLKRCGIDYDIYNPDFGNIMHNFDEEIIVSDFSPIPLSDGTKINNDREMINYVFSKLTEEKEDKTKSAESRQLFVTNYEPAIRNTIVRIVQLKSRTLKRLFKDLSQLSISEISAMLSDESGSAIKDFLKTYLDMDHMQYDEEVLSQECAILLNFLSSVLKPLIMILLNYSENMSRIVDMHYTETYYVLFKNCLA